MSQKSALLIIGNEILSGRTQDQNAQFIGEKMAAHGIPLSEVRIVPDIESKIIEALNTLRSTYDFVFTTGGIGPTHDDITSATVAKAFNLPFERHPQADQTLSDYYDEGEYTDARATMAYMPQGAKLIPNPVSGAPGFNVENVYVMAGVPRIMQAMLGNVLAQITAGEKIMSNAVACDLQESVVAKGLGEIQNQYDDIDIGSYPNFRGGVLSVSIVLRGTSADSIKKATNDVLTLIQSLNGNIISESYEVSVK